MQAAKGNPFSGLDHRRDKERCIVTAVNTERYICTVYTEHGSLIDGVAFPDGGDTIPALKSTEYAVDFGLGEPRLVRAVLEPEETAPVTELTVSGVAKPAVAPDPANRNEGRGRRRGRRPSDVLPGDWLKQGSSGQLVGVLEGGVVMMKASELAQIILTQANNLVRIVGKNVVMDTGMGTLSMVTKEGKSTLDLKIGGDEATEGNPDADNFRIRAELGTEGELVDFRVTDGEGRAVYRMHVDPDGRVQTQCLRKTEAVEEDIVVLAGTDASLSAGGDVSLSAGKAVSVEAAGNVGLTSGGSLNVGLGGDVAANAAGAVQVSALGGVSITASGGGTQPALSVTAVNGDVAFSVGDPSKGSLPPTGNNFTVTAPIGDIRLTTLLGKFSVNTSVPGACKLGGPAGGAVGAVVYEQLVSLLSAMALYLDTHTHGVPAAGGTPTTPPVTPASSVIMPSLPLLRSLYVTYGG